ncbi:MAG: cell division protein FtsW [Candidatus Paceibacteria bacterium]|jgi:cell division protein FtsW
MMVKSKKQFDRPFLVIVSLLIIVGLFSFISASFGVLAKNSTKFYGIILNQGLGLVLGLGVMWLSSRIHYTIWKKYAFYIFALGVVAVGLVFIPELGNSHGGATRWLNLGPFSFQPVELLKVGFVIYFAAWLGWTKAEYKKMKSGILPLAILFVLGAFLLLRQPDTKSLLLMVGTGGTLAYLAGLPKKYIFGSILIALVGFASLIAAKPYLLKRVQTFVDPSSDPQGSSFQLQQSLIAIGSGGVFGRGLGQSIQKFSYLPEPQGDSIFAVIGEEFGFVGSVFVILLYVAFGQRALWIARHATDSFGRLVVSGLAILLLAQSFLNIYSITGLFPLTGVPLVFMSHGGSALIISLFAVGIILNVSRYITNSKS